MLHVRADEAADDDTENTAFFNLTWWQLVCLALGAAAILGVGIWIAVQRVRNRKKLKQMPDPLLPTVDPRAKDRLESGLSEATMDSLGSELDRDLIMRNKKSSGIEMNHRRRRDRERKRDSGERRRRRDRGGTKDKDERAPRKRFRDSVFSSYHSMKKAAVKLRYIEAKAKLKEELRREALTKAKKEMAGGDSVERRAARRNGQEGRHERGEETERSDRKHRRLRRPKDASASRTRTKRCDPSPDSIYSTRDTVYLSAPAVGHIRGPTPKPLMPVPQKHRRQRSEDEESYVSLDILSGYTSDEPTKRSSAYPQKLDIEELAADRDTHGVGGVNAAIWQTALQWGRKAGLAA